MKPLVLVLGCGSIGRRHATNLRRLGHRVAAFDPDPARQAWAGKELDAAVVRTVDEGLALRPAAVWVCTPPVHHAAPGLAALASGAAVFLEKPLAHSLADARRLTHAAARARRLAAVGYQLRWHPALRWIKARLDEGAWGKLLFLRAEFGQYLPDWRPWQDFRRSYTARRSLGGGILLDASHELDLVRWLAGEARSVSCLARTLSLPIDVEDTASMVLELRSGAVAEVHLDMVQRGFRRGMLLACERATVELDLATARVVVTRGRGKSSAKIFSSEPNDLYVAETRAFLRRMSGGGADGLVPLADGAKTLELVEAARRSSRSGRRETLS